jgi:hypothetical protein
MTLHAIALQYLMACVSLCHLFLLLGNTPEISGYKQPLLDNGYSIFLTQFYLQSVYIHSENWCENWL